MDIAALFLVFSTLLTAPLAAIAVSLIALVKIWLIFRKNIRNPSYSPAGYSVFIPLRQFSPIGAYVAMIIIGFHKESGWDGYTPSTIVLGFLLFVTACSFVPVILAAIILIPVEKMIQQRYVRDAKRILNSMRVSGLSASQVPMARQAPNIICTAYFPRNMTY